MSEMKMSDVFHLPLELRKDLVHFSKSDTCYFKVESVKSRDEELQVTYCVHQAINNHDSLVEEVERLRSERDELVSILSSIETVLDLGVAQNGNGIFGRYRMPIKELLAKIKGEDNE